MTAFLDEQGTELLLNQLIQRFGPDASLAEVSARLRSGGLSFECVDCGLTLETEGLHAPLGWGGSSQGWLCSTCLGQRERRSVA